MKYPTPDARRRLAAPRASLTALIAMTTALSACTTINLEAGKDLAAAGQAAATTLKADAAAASADYATNAERGALLQVIGQAAAPGTIGTPDENAATRRVAAALQARVKVFAELETLYGSFAQGTKKSASADTQAAFSSFLTAADSYRAAVGLLPGASLAEDPRAEGLGLILGKFAAYIQQRKMKQASQVIRGQLAMVKQTLQAEQQAVTSTRAASLVNRTALYDALIRAGLADPTPRFETLTGLAGAKPSPTAAEIYRGNPRLQTALTHFNIWDLKRKEAAIKASYDKSLEVFDALDAQHRKFEAGEPFTFTRLVTELEELKAITLLLMGGPES